MTGTFEAIRTVFPPPSTDKGSSLGNDHTVELIVRSDQFQIMKLDRDEGLSESRLTHAFNSPNQLDSWIIQQAREQYVVYSIHNYLMTSHPLQDLKSEYSPRISGPVQFLIVLRTNWNLEYSELGIMLGLDQSEEARCKNILKGIESLSGRDMNDRFSYLFSIRSYLDSLFRDLEVENKWLRKKQHMLYGESPMSLLLEGSIKSMLAVEQYVEMVSGV